MVYVLLYIKKLIQNGYRSIGSILKSKVRYNYSDIDASKIYIIINIFELSNREHKYMDQWDFFAACNRNAR